MEFIKMLRTLKLESKLREEVENLYMRKKSGEELDKDNRIPVINNFLDEKLQHFEEYVKKMRPKEQVEAGSLVMDNIFHEALDIKVA